METFINEFKKTSYYRNLFISNNNILAIYLMGSRCAGLQDEISDYDITIITLNGEYIDFSKWEYLRYKTRKVHWYAHSLEALFNLSHKNVLRYLGLILFRNMHEKSNLIIYENNEYRELLQKFFKIKNQVSDLNIYQLFELYKEDIDNILKEGRVADNYKGKYLYHLCAASYYITGETLNTEFLKKVKRIKSLPISVQQEALLIERLQIYKNYIEQHPIDVLSEIKILSKELIPHE